MYRYIFIFYRISVQPKSPVTLYNRPWFIPIYRKLVFLTNFIKHGIITFNHIRKFLNQNKQKIRDKKNVCTSPFQPDALQNINDISVSNLQLHTGIVALGNRQKTSSIYLSRSFIVPTCHHTDYSTISLLNYT